MKYKIEKNTVQETLILPLYSRKLCTELYPNLYQDETAVRLLDQIDMFGHPAVEHRLCFFDLDAQQLVCGAVQCVNDVDQRFQARH